MRPFDYAHATNVNDVLEQIGQANHGAVRPLAGGTDLLTLLKGNIIAPTALVDIKRLAERNGSPMCALY